MIGRLYNNLGISSLGMAFTLQHMAPLSLTKSLLVMPLITHKELLQYLARKTTTIHSLEQLLVSHQKCFSNFNSRFYDSLPTSINSIQFLAEIEMIDLVDGEMVALQKLDYDPAMGKRAQKIFDASQSIAEILKSDTAQLYTNLRIQL